MLTACSGETDNTDNENDEYNAINKTIMDNEQYQVGSDYYDVNIVTNALDDGTYRYYVIVDNPQMAMYNVVAMACDVKNINVNSDVMCPNIGIYEDTQYKMVPNQSNKDEGFVKGFSLSGISDTESVSLNMVIMWNNMNNTKSFQEFVNVTYVPETAEEVSADE